MLTCITFSKQVDEGGDKGVRGTPSTKEAVKSLTAQIKDIAMKISGSSKQSKPSSPSFRLWQTYYNPKGSKGYYPGDPSEQRGNQQYNAGSSYNGGAGAKGETSSMEASVATSSRDEVSISNCNASDVKSEWIVEDEPGVHITIRQLADGTRELS